MLTYLQDHTTGSTTTSKPCSATPTPRHRSDMATRHGSATVTLPSDTEILITRSFEAPRTLIWDVLTTPRHLLRWWGPDFCPLVACSIDLRPGGAWRYLARDAEGNELAWRGVYQEIDIPKRMVSTEVFEGFPEAESLNTMTLIEHDGVTTLRTLVKHASREFRDGHVQSGMEGGMQLTFNRLEDLLALADTPAERFRRVGGRFSDRVNEVSSDKWSNPAPCAGWIASDVVGHLVAWVPAVLGPAGIVFETEPAAAQDPAGAWANLSGTLQAALDDAETAQRRFEAGPAGEMSVEQAIDRLVLGDVLVHTWDLARATGLDERLDEGMVSAMLEGLQPIEELLRNSGHYGPRVPVAPEADPQTQLIAFTGRQP